MSKATNQDDAVLTQTRAPKSPTSGRLLLASEVPVWYAHNAFIRTGYRPVNNSVRLCLESIGHLHNETVNIWTHLAPGVVALLGNLQIHLYFRSRYPAATWTDQLVFHIYLTTSVLCFGISSLYHALLCHSEGYADVWGRLDYATIVLQILGSFISGLYIGFYCEPSLQKLYWTMICSLGLLTAIVVLSPRLQSPRWRVLRLCMFVSTGLSAFAPIVHAATIFPYQKLDKQAGLRFYYLEGVAIMIGVLFYVSHFPESRYPGRFDMWGASHQIFHCMVVLAAAIHLYGILDAFDWNYRSPRCRGH